jgi:ABC-type transport system involved in multi-copper enzyme maturation permease subunit
MNGALVIARATVGELTRRRVFAVVIVLTLGFLGLYELANQLAFHQIAHGRVQQQPGIFVDAHTLAGATLLGLAMFATLFLGAVLAVFLTMTAVRGDAEQGLLQPLVVRGPGRPAYLAGRILAAALVSSLYTLLVYLVSVLITGQAGGWWPDHVLTPGLALMLAVVVLAGMSLLGSVFLNSTANGIAMLMVYGAGLVAGLMGQIGYALPSQRLQQVGKIASWALPFDALYQAGLHALTADTQGLTGVIVHLGPLGGAQAAGPALIVWALAYLGAVLGAALMAFQRTDV